MFRKKVKVQIDKMAYMPKRAYKNDAGLDLFSPVNSYINPHESVVIDTGVHIAIPKRYTGFLKSKSGMNVKFSVLNEGVIDSEYTGTITVKLYNHGDKTYQIKRGDKISQLVILPILLPKLELVDALPKAERGNNGFGSTGR